MCNYQILYNIYPINFCIFHDRNQYNLKALDSFHYHNDSGKVMIYTCEDIFEEFFDGRIEKKKKIQKKKNKLVSFINNGNKDTLEINVASDDNVNNDLVTCKNECNKLNKDKQELILFIILILFNYSNY